jgi:hypothetical protein
MAVNANVVNVYGRAINGGGGLPGAPGTPGAPGGGGGGLPPRGSTPQGKPTSLIFNPVTGVATVAGLVSYGLSENWRNISRMDANIPLEFNAVTGKPATLASSSMGVPIDKDTADFLKNYYDLGGGSSIVDGVGEIKKSIENAKIENQIQLTMNPNIIISGELKGQFTNLDTRVENNSLVMGAYNQMNKVQTQQAKRYPDRVKGW